MPNHVTNILTIIGSEEAVAAARAKLITHVEEHDEESWMGVQHIEEHDTVDFNLAVPMPEGMLENNGPTNDPIFPEWYTWSCDNWGTKWNAYAADIVEDSPKKLKVRFDTAWSTPFQWFEKYLGHLTEYDGDELFIDLHWADEDFSHNTGYFTYANKVMTVTQFKGGSEEAHRHAADVKGYDPREEYPEDYEDVEFNENLRTEDIVEIKPAV